MTSNTQPEIGLLNGERHTCDPRCNLRFKEAENRKQRRRRTAGLFLGQAGGE